MRIVVQHPFADLRSLATGVATALPHLPGRTVDTGMVDSLRRFGWAEVRNADLAFPDESCYYGAHRALRLNGLGRRVFAARGTEVEPRILSYRRLFITDQRVSARVEVGVRLNARQRPLEFSGLIRLLATALDLPSQVDGGIASLRAPLGRQGRALAHHYADVTSRSDGGVDPLAAKLVRACPPLVLVALRHGEIVPAEVGTRLPLFRRLDRENTQGVDVWFGQVTDGSRRSVACWLLSPGAAKEHVLEKLALCLLRLNADNRAVDEVLRWLDSSPAFATDAIAVKSYLRYVKEKVLDRTDRANLKQSAIVEAITAVSEVRPEIEALHLRQRLDRALARITSPAEREPHTELSAEVGANRSGGAVEVDVEPDLARLECSWRTWICGMEPEPDLVVVIRKSGSTALHWTTFSHPFELAPAAERKEVGADLDAFPESVAQAIEQCRDTNSLYYDVRGVGTIIGAKVPRTLWSSLKKASKLGRSPNLLLLSEEPFVPWELALESKDSPFLAARARVGRWMLPKDGEDSPWPPAEIRIRRAALVSGRYSGADDLPKAREEVRAIGDHLREVGPSTQITNVEADDEIMLAYLSRQPEDNLLHFAVHGSFDPSSHQDSIIATGGEPLHALAVRSLDLPGRPVVFLNACEAGRGMKLLDLSAGMAESFLTAGASAVIAPLWTIDDDIAHDVSIALYRATLNGNEGLPVAEFLRTQLERFVRGTMSPTSVAYRFFGHPECRLTVA